MVRCKQIEQLVKEAAVSDWRGGFAEWVEADTAS